MREILIQSKITTPRLHDKIVHRARLTALLDENIDKNLIIVCAPAGFGKTTLVLDYLSLHNNEHAWLSIPHKGIEDASTFFEYIIGALHNLNQDFGTNTLEVMKVHLQNPALSKDLAYAFTASFVNEFNKFFKHDITFVIDDLHYIESEKSQKWLKEFFGELLDNIPPNLHLIIVTRIMPDLNLTSLNAKRNVYTFTEKELNFDVNETKELLGSIYKYEYSNEDLKLLEDNLKGWVTGIHLLLQTYGEDFNKVKYSHDIAFENIFDFFAQEIFDNLNSELQQFLLITSLIENFDSKISNSVLDIRNSNEFINELVHKNLFIQQVRFLHEDGSEQSVLYCYHALFRNFLNQRIKKLKIAEDINRLMEKIGEYYLSSGDKISAINYFIEAKNFEKAVPLIEKEYKEISDKGKFDILWGWFNQIPEDIIFENENILYIMGFLYQSSDYERSLYYINRALELIQISINENIFVACYRTKAHLYMLTGKTNEAKIEMERLLEYSLTPRNKAYIYIALSNLYSQSGQYREAIRLLERANESCENNNLGKDVKINIYYSFAITYSLRRDYEKSLFYYKKILESEEGIHNIIAANGNIASAYCGLGNYSNSLKYFDKTFQLLESFYLSKQRITLTVQKAFLMQNIGDFAESTKILENIYSYAEKNNEQYILWYITYFLFENYYISDDYDNCKKYLDLNRIFTETLNIEHFRKQFQIKETLFSLKYEINSSTEEKLLDAYNYFDSVNDKNYALEALMWLSDYYLRLNNTELALKNLAIILKESNFMANDITKSRNLIDFALSRPELAQYKDKIHNAFIKFFDRLNIEGTSDEYKRKMKIEIEKLYDVKMISFGTLEFISRGIHVTESKWTRKKAKPMLAYIMVDPKAKYNKEKFIDIFFSDTKSENAEESFRQVLFNIRSIFKNPYLNFLTSRGKTLYLNPDCYFKSDVTEFEKYYKTIRSNNITSEEKIQACKDAIELYKGDFLEGYYEPWCEDLRDEYRNKFITISEILLLLLNESREQEDIVHYSEKLLMHDRLNEQAYINLVEAHVRTGKLRSAREIYSKMLKAYEEELSEKPDSKIITKIESLLEI